MPPKDHFSVTVKAENYKKAEELAKLLNIRSVKKVYETLCQLGYLKSEEGEKEINETVRHGFGIPDLDILPPYALPINVNPTLEGLASLVPDEDYINSIKSLSNTPIVKLEKIANDNVSDYVEKVDYVGLGETDIQSKLGNNFNSDVEAILNAIKVLNESPQFCESRYNEFLYTMFGAGKATPNPVKPVRLNTNNLMVASYYSKQLGDDIDNIIRAGEFENTKNDFLREIESKLSDVITHPQNEDFIEKHLSKKVNDPELNVKPIIASFKKLPRRYRI